MGSISLLITIGSKIVQTALQVIEGDIIQYNILLGISWIRDMQYVLSTYHNCLKYIHKGIVHCVHGDENPYSHYNSAHLSKDVALPSTHYFTTPKLPKKPSIVEVGKNNYSLNSLKEEHFTNQESTKT